MACGDFDEQKLYFSKFFIVSTLCVLFHIPIPRPWRHYFFLQGQILLHPMWVAANPEYLLIISS